MSLSRRNAASESEERPYFVIRKNIPSKLYRLWSNLSSGLPTWKPLLVGRWPCIFCNLPPANGGLHLKRPVIWRRAFFSIYEVNLGWSLADGDVFAGEDAFHRTGRAHLATHGAGAFTFRFTRFVIAAGFFRVDGQGNHLVEVDVDAGFAHGVIPFLSARDALDQVGSVGCDAGSMMPSLTSSTVGRRRCSAGVT